MIYYCQEKLKSGKTCFQVARQRLVSMDTDCLWRCKRHYSLYVKAVRIERKMKQSKNRKATS